MTYALLSVANALLLVANALLLVANALLLVANALLLVANALLLVANALLLPLLLPLLLSRRLIYFIAYINTWPAISCRASAGCFSDVHVIFCTWAACNFRRW